MHKSYLFVKRTSQLMLYPRLYRLKIIVNNSLLLKLFCDHFATVLSSAFKSVNDSPPQILSSFTHPHVITILHCKKYCWFNLKK